MVLDLYFIIKGDPIYAATALMDGFDSAKESWGSGDADYSTWLEAFAAFRGREGAVVLHMQHAVQPTVSLHELDEGWVVGVAVPAEEVLADLVGRCEVPLFAVDVEGWFTLFEQPPPNSRNACLHLEQHSQADWRLPLEGIPE